MSVETVDAIDWFEQSKTDIGTIVRYIRFHSSTQSTPTKWNRLNPNNSPSEEEQVESLPNLH